MKITLEIPDFEPNTGIQLKWENDFEIKLKIEQNTVVITANCEGLTSLANHFLNLANKEIPVNYHMHFDEFNSLEEGSADLIVQKI